MTSCYSEHMSEETHKGIMNLIPWLVSAKVTPPKRHKILAERVFILDKLFHHQDRSLTILEAPGGFGKSTLLSLWRSRLLKSDYKVAWLTLEAEDTASAVITYLAYSFQLAGINMAETNLLVKTDGSPDDPMYNISLIISALQNCEGKIVLLLDDADRIVDEDAVQVLNMLTKHAPDNLHIAIAFRQNPGIALSNLLLDGEAIRLTAENLRFSFEEAENFFDHQLSKRDMKTVFERTEGWPVALRLIKSEIENTRDYIEKIRHFSGDKGLAAEYFSEQVFARLSKSEQFFLLDISILEWLEISLIDAIRDTNDARRILDGLSHLEGVIVPFEDQEDTYRLHALFREFLFNTHQRENADRVIELQKKAAITLAEKNRLLSALRHARQAGEKMLLGQILDKAGGIKLWLREGMTRIIPANKLLDDEIIGNFPRLGFLRCIVQIKSGQFKEAQYLFNQLDQATDGFKNDREGGDNKALFLEHICVRSMLAAYGCFPMNDDLLSVLIPMGVETNGVDDITLGQYYTILCVAYKQRAAFAEAWHYGKEAIKHFHLCGSNYGELYIDYHFGSIAMVRGETVDAAAHYARAQKNMRRFFPRDQGLQLIGEILSAELDLERNCVNLLKRKMNNIAERLHNSDTWFDIYAAAYSVLGEVIYEENGFRDTSTFLIDAAERAEEQGLGKVTGYLAAVRVSVLMSDGRFEQAILLHEKSGLPKNSSEILDLNIYTWREVEIFSCVLLQIQMTSGAYEDARELISAFLPFVEEKKLLRPQVRVLILAAAMESLSGVQGAAFDYLDRTFTLIRHNDYIRSFLRGGEDMYKLLVLYKSERASEAQKIQIDKIIAHMQSSQESDSDELLFSEREIEVLKGLERGFQDKMIARSLSVTPHAVRYHLKNIYRKTNASNRMQALNKAKELGALNNILEI